MNVINRINYYFNAERYKHRAFAFFSSLSPSETWWEWQRTSSIPFRSRVQTYTFTHSLTHLRVFLCSYPSYSGFFHYRNFFFKRMICLWLRFNGVFHFFHMCDCVRPRYGGRYVQAHWLNPWFLSAKEMRSDELFNLQTRFRTFKKNTQIIGWMIFQSIIINWIWCFFLIL